jgi:phage-related protein
MKQLSDNLIEKKNELATADAWLVLIDIAIPNVPGVIHLVNNTEDITFGGQVYTAANFMLDPPKFSSKGDIPSVTLRVCNVAQTMEPYMEEHDGGIGSTVTVRVVNAGLLEENYAELEMTFDVIGAAADVQWATFQLGAPNPLLFRFPLDRYIARRCRYVAHYKGAECAYVGAIPSCNGTLDDCRAHGNSTRFGGFPGLAEGGFRLV